MFSIKISELVKNGEVIIKTGPFGTQLKASEYVKMGTPVLNVKNLGYGRVVDEKLDMVGNDTVERLSAHLLRTGDIVFGRKGAVERHAFISQNEKGWMQGSDCIRLRVNSSRINPKYLSYYFLTDKHKAFMMGMCSHGTTMASLNQKIIEQIEVPLPSIDVQNKIVALLGCIDEKVKINEKINDNLYAQAKAIFDNHFINIDAIPAGWRKGNLLDIANYLNGLAMQKFRPQGNEIGLPVLKIKELRQGSCDDSSELCSLSIKPEYIIHNGDVIFSWSGSLLVDIWCGGTCGLNQHLFKVTSDVYDKWFYYLWTAHHLARFIAIAADKATTMGHIKREELAKAEVLIPCEEDYMSLSSVMQPIFELIISNRIESRKLAALRDELLPKLMSGEIDVSAVQL